MPWRAPSAPCPWGAATIRDASPSSPSAAPARSTPAVSPSCWTFPWSSSRRGPACSRPGDCSTRTSGRPSCAPSARPSAAWATGAAGVSTLESAWAELEAQARVWLDGEQVPRDQMRFERAADLRYEHQSFELTCPLGAGPLTPERLERAGLDVPRRAPASLHVRPAERAHRAGHAPGHRHRRPPKARRANRPSPRTAGDAGQRLSGDASSSRRSTSADEASSTRPATRASELAPGMTFDGPAIIEQSDSTPLVAPGFRARVDDAHRNIDSSDRSLAHRDHRVPPRGSDYARDHSREPGVDHPRHGALDGAVRDVALHQGEEGLLRRRLRHAGAHRRVPYLGQRARHARAHPQDVSAREHAAGRRLLVQRPVSLRRRRPASSGHGLHGAHLPRRDGWSASPRPSATTRTSAACARAASRRTPRRSTTRACSSRPSA